MNELERPNIWWKALSQYDYPKIAELGEITTIIRILPGLSANGQLYDAIMEKDVSTTMYPDTPKWLVPVCVLSDMLHPERNGFVGVMDITKTMKRCIQGKNTPPNYFDLTVGYNFNIIVSMEENKNKTSFFPNYNRSHYDANPSPIDGNYVMPRLQALKIQDFAAWVTMFNENMRKKLQNNNTGYSASNVAQSSLTPPVDYNAPQQQVASPQNTIPQQPMIQPQAQTPQQVAPVTQAPVAQPQQPVAINHQPVGAMTQAPVQTHVIAQQAVVQPQATMPQPTNQVPWEPAPQTPQAQTPVPQSTPDIIGGFDAVFATPAG